MTDRLTGITVSLFIHSILFLVLLGLTGGRVERSRTVTLDFTVVNTPGHEGVPGTAGTPSGKGSSGRPAGTEGAGARKTPGETTVGRSAERSPAGDRPTLSAKTESPVSVVAEPASGGGDRQVSGSGGEGSGGPSGSVSGSGSGSGSRGGPLLVNYGEGGGGGFAFIRENIMRNITYPERARRMGWEGRVILSFTVYESGQIGDIRLVKSSGFAVLDEGALEGLKKTRFSKAVPVRLSVVLPVEYRLSN